MDASGSFLSPRVVVEEDEVAEGHNGDWDILDIAS